MSEDAEVQEQTKGGGLKKGGPPIPPGGSAIRQAEGHLAEAAKSLAAAAEATPDEPTKDELTLYRDEVRDVYARVAGLGMRLRDFAPEATGSAIRGGNPF